MTDRQGAFGLAEGIDRADLRAAYQRHGHVRIGPFLTDAAARALARHLAARADEWRIILNSDEKVFEIDRATALSMAASQRAALDNAVHEAARHGFQFRYSAIRVPDEADARMRSPHLLDAFAAFMSGPVVLDLIRYITGRDAIAFADGQATRYTSGDFLTAHDDDVAGKHRHAAYVLGLTEGWRPEWGGLLTFHHPNGGFSGMAPAFNTLDLFRVPQRHSVSYVTPSADGARMSVTGWFRAQG
ncbi:2OG-Fe(II) oxygenase family protein [Sphingobium sp. CAP-1]|uniref:2OG-Fe(II) oxygenase family protein n=1 Tax=Sphingobium sp. CAP-1 TaxID=2676077 RepID=UPI0012BB2930|nr:2OG-Fe(II) oxygenase family protein [Sphingobium sp. CAP-1]QGP79564.1 proline hydroxylase [Sphingobium sp. CAP-1]